MLSLNSATIQALNAEEVTLINLFDIYYQPSDFDDADSYEVGDLCWYTDSKVYECILNNPAPSTSPPNGTYWQEYSSYPLRFTDWSENVVYNSHTYVPFGVKLGDIRWGADGKMQDLTLAVANIGDDRFIQECIENYEVIGQKVVITQLVKDIDDPIQVTFKVKGAKSNKGQVTFTLAMGFDYLKSEMPTRTMFQRYCRWTFKDSNCQYSGIDTTCNRTFEECKDNKQNILNFGGFPGIINQRFYF